MITYVVGDLFQSPAKVLVNTVNTVGVMGKGIALQFKRLYPEMFKQYQQLCEQNMFEMGQLWIYKTPHKWVLNFPTKNHWRHKSKPEYIELGLKKFVRNYEEKGINSISFPMLGCGNGELDWETQVRPLMEEYLGGLPIDIYIHRYSSPSLRTPEHKNVAEISKWLHSEPQALAFTEFWEDLKHMVNSTRQFTETVSDASFSVQFDEEETVVITSTRQEQVEIPKDSMLDLWQYIRSSGYAIPQNLPSGLDEYAPKLMGMLMQLPYLHPVMLSRNTLDENTSAFGLQLIPLYDATSDIEEYKVELA
ncbi:MAG: macro domain-containing protein [Aggregatilineales bacterium]